jgi:CDP-diacylglycerol--glycerol-3-phosphate 3-phosphatidyltransferase
MITDVLDGRLARKKNQVTNYGKFVDPIVDKILVISALVLFIEMGIVPAWIVILIISREFLIVGLRLIIKDIKIVEASFLGKLKTATQMLGISFILIILLLKDFYNTNLFDIVTYLIILIMMVVTLASGINYLIKNREFILELKYK